ncbi:hypothetical protein FOCC_FOCC007211 [Frankliniella occidentalis]|nr:hypothetical protein FOCC_FOCC007211 [Frankliniella occidentalis]
MINRSNCSAIAETPVKEVDSTTTTPAIDLGNSNTTAIEAISERLSEVTALAEQLDRALTAARLDPTAPPPPPSVEDATDAPDTTVNDTASIIGEQQDDHGGDATTATASPATGANEQAERSDATAPEVLAGILVQREVRETRQLRVRRGGGETRAESELSCSRIEAQHINNGCNTSTSSNTSATSTLSSGTRGALDAVLLVGQDDVDAAYRQQLEESLPLPLPLDLDLDLQLPSPLAFADPPAEYVPEYASEYDEHVDLSHDDLEDMLPPPPQELLDGLKEVSLRDENANHVVLSVLEPPPPPPPPLQSTRFMPHIMRHAIKGVF